MQCNSEIHNYIVNMLKVVIVNDSKQIELCIEIVRGESIVNNKK